MSKRKNPSWYIPLSKRPATTGTRECQECGMPAYSHHRPNCPKVA